MRPTKIIFTLLLGTALLLTQAGSVFAAPNLQEGPITGTVTALECGADGQGNTTVVVKLEDALGNPQTVTITLASAQTLGLISLDEAGLPDCSPEAFLAILEAAPPDGLAVEISPEDIVPVEEETKHPVGYALSLFFGDIVDYDTIMQTHEDGTGFGVIAQALWMTVKMEGDSDFFMEVLTARETGDYSAFTLKDGSIPQNWGQFKKAVLDGDKKNNLGSVMSDKDDDGDKTNNGNGPDKDKDNNGNNKDKDKGNKKD